MTMKAAVMKGPRQLVVEEVPKPKPAKEQVLVKMRYCGICGSDLHYYESEHTPPGSIMGHEWVGEVVSKGAGTTKWSVGDRVWPGVLHSSGWKWRPEYGWDRAALVRASRVKDMGGYGEYAVYHQDEVAGVPQEVADIEAVMADQAATALGGVRATQLQIGEGLLVVGAGPIGLWALRCGQLAGANPICVAEILEGRAEIARRMGADMVVNPTRTKVREEVAELFQGKGPEVVLECAGAPGALQFAFDVTRPGGRIAAIGLSDHPIPISIWNLVIKAIKVYGVIDIDFAGGMEIIRHKKVNCRDFLTDIVPLEKITEAFERLLHPVDEEKIVIGYEQ